MFRGKTETCRKSIKKEKQYCEMREILDMLISEIEEELKNCTSNLLWFIPQQQEESFNTGVYSHKVGQQDYKGTFSNICFKIIFNKSK